MNDLAAFLLLVPLAAIAAVVALTAARRRGHELKVHEGGLVAQYRGKRDVVVFDEVDELWFEQYWVHSPLMFARITALRFIDHGGARHRVSMEVEDNLPILRWVIRRCSDPLLREAREAIAAGSTVTFGKIRLDREGITIGSARSLWREVRLVRSHLGALSLFRRMPIIAWRTVAMDTIPHATVFGRLVAELAPRVEHDYPAGTSTE